MSLLAAPLLGRGAVAAPGPQLPVLVYHRFAPHAVDGMTLTVAHLDAQLRLLERLSCRVIPLREAVAWRRSQRATLPPRAVVLTADDGHRSQFETLAPRLRERGWPLTLFVYPSAISNADYAMSWPQLRELAAQTGFEIQSHTFWHPNLLRERARLAPDAFRRLATGQLTRSRDTLEQRLSRAVTLLAWPFGLSDEGLQAWAAEAGYEAAFALGNRSASRADPLFALPRHLIVDAVDERQLAARLEAAFAAGSAS